jgi:beta-lactamase regulating signal transducer with metallopeptidase domain
MTHVNFAVTTLLNGLWEGTFLAVAMWLFLKMLPRLNPTTRFTVLWVTLLAVVALLLGQFTRGAFPSAAQTDSSAAAATNQPADTAFTPVIFNEPGVRPHNSDTVPKPQPVADPNSNSESVMEPAPDLAESRNPASTSGWSALPSIEHPLIRIHSGRLLGAFEIIWFFLSFLMLARLGLGYLKLRGLKANATPLPAKWQTQLRSLSGINGVRRQPQLLISNRIAAPISLGFLNPAILIPQTLLDTLSDSELEHVILHELGHLQRLDDWTNLAQKLTEAMVPIQPVIYWIGHRMSIERELACDDWVVAATGTAESYAASLTKVAELSKWARAGVLAASATGNRSQLFSRVHHMLDKTRNAAPKLAIAPLGAAIAAVGILVYGGMRAPQIIAFAQTSASESGQLPFTSPGPAQSPQTLHLLTPAPISSAILTSAPPLTSTIPAAPPALLAMASPLSPPAPAAPLSPPAPAAPLSPPAPAAPLSPPAPAAPAQTQQSGETHVEMTTRNGWTALSVKVDGAVEFTDDDHDVKSLSPGGHFRIEEGTLLSAHVYDVRADSAGNLTRTYSVGSSVKPLDAEGQAWLAQLMPQVIRDSGIGAAPRVARILRQGGPQAVMNEIGLIHSDGSKRIYLEQLFSQATLNPEQMRESAKLIQGISSDGDKAQVLVNVDSRYFTGDLRQNLFEAVESIHSDGDKRRVLSDIVSKDAGNDETLLRVARAAKHISSDGDKAEVLIGMAGPYRDNGGLGVAYFEAVKSISSDGDHARVLSTMLASHGDDRDTLARILRSAGTISSDGDKARVLKEAVARYSDDETISKAFMDAANSISSDGDHQQVLVALVHKQGLSAATAGEIARSAQRISSDGDKARVLVELLAVNVEPIRADFFASVDTINSDGDHSRVLLTLLDKPGTSSAMALAAIQSATRISSDGDKGRVFMDAAQRYSGDAQVNAALRKAVESLHSDGEYRSVMSELARRDSGN